MTTKPALCLKTKRTKERKKKRRRNTALDRSSVNMENNTYIIIIWNTCKQFAIYWICWWEANCQLHLLIKRHEPNQTTQTFVLATAGYYFRPSSSLEFAEASRQLYLFKKCHGQIRLFSLRGIHVRVEKGLEFRVFRFTWLHQGSRRNNIKYSVFDMIKIVTYILKAPYSLKQTFYYPERFNKLIYSINIIIKCGTWQPVKFQLVSRSWNEMNIYRISELMFPTLIQRCDKYHFIFVKSSSKTRD